MTSKLKHLLFPFCLMLSSSLICKINLDEINPSLSSLAEYYNLQSALTNQMTPLESIDLTIRLLEKASNDMIAEAFSQKIYSSMHKYLPLLTSAIVFEKNYTKVSDFAEELFNCEIKPLDKKTAIDQTHPQITPFRYPLIYAILAISKIALLKEQNPTQELTEEQIESLKTKIHKNFKEAFYKEKISLKKHSHISPNNINELCDAIELLIPTKETPSLLNPTNWNFAKIGAFVGIACGITLTIYLTKLLSSAKKLTDKAPEEINDIKRTFQDAIGSPQPSTTDPRRTATLAQTMGAITTVIGTHGPEDPAHPKTTASLTQAMASLERTADAVTNLIGEEDDNEEDDRPEARLASRPTPPSAHAGESSMAPAAAASPSASPSAERDVPKIKKKRKTLSELVTTCDETMEKIGHTFNSSKEDEEKTIPQALGAATQTLHDIERLLPEAHIALVQAQQRCARRLVTHVPDFAMEENADAFLEICKKSDEVEARLKKQRAEAALIKQTSSRSRLERPSASPPPTSASSPLVEEDDDAPEEEVGGRGGEGDEGEEEAG